LKAQLKNPWIKRNPLLSMWMSGANAAMGRARGQAIAEGRRQAAFAVAAGTKKRIQFWTDATTASSPRRRKKAR
jgi:hypothetical protein